MPTIKKKKPQKPNNPCLPRPPGIFSKKMPGVLFLEKNKKLIAVCFCHRLHGKRNLIS